MQTQEHSAVGGQQPSQLQLCVQPRWFQFYSVLFAEGENCAQSYTILPPVRSEPESQPLSLSLTAKYSKAGTYVPASSRVLGVCFVFVVKSKSRLSSLGGRPVVLCSKYLLSELCVSQGDVHDPRGLRTLHHPVPAPDRREGRVRQLQVQFSGETRGGALQRENIGETRGDEEGEGGHERGEKAVDDRRHRLDPLSVFPAPCPLVLLLLGPSLS